MIATHGEIVVVRRALIFGQSPAMIFIRVAWIVTLMARSAAAA
jgi:hypothetical protein